jgi:hypothetical protein
MSMDFLLEIHKKFDDYSTIDVVNLKNFIYGGIYNRYMGVGKI